MGVSIIGTGHTKFGRLDKTVYELMEDAAKEALKESGFTGKDIDAVYIGNYASIAFNNQSHIAPYIINIDADLRFKPAIRTENACASSSIAIHDAYTAIESGKYKNILVIGVEKMTDLNGRGVTETLAKASYWPIEGEDGYTFPGLYAYLAKGYMKHFGYTQEELSDTLSLISVKAHKNAMSNPYAHMHKEYTHEFASTVSDKNPIIAEPLKLSDCSLVSDGAAALVLTTTENAKELKDEVVELSAINISCDYLSVVDGLRNDWEQKAIQVGFEKTLKEAEVTLDDIDLAEVHDCFTINELLIYEAMGLTEPGKGREALLDGTVNYGGKLPINVSGGLKSKGHPVGATGASMHVLATRQLLGKAIGLQVEDAKIAATINVGGSGGTNVISILKKIK